MTHKEEKLVIKAAMSLLGSKTSAKKKAASQKNGESGGRPKLKTAEAT